MSPNILVLAPYLSRTQAGAAQATIHIVNALARRSSGRVSVFTYGCEADLLDPTVEVIRAEAPREPPLLWRFPSAYTVRQHHARLRAAGLPAASLCYTQNTTLALAYRRLHPRVPIISHTGAVLADRECLEESTRPRWQARVEASLLRRLEERSYRERDWHHIVSTRLVAEQRQQHFGLPPGFFTVQPYGLDLSRFARLGEYEDMRARHSVPRDAFVVVTAARLIGWKNIDMVLRAIALSGRRHWMFVAGAGPEAESLEELARSLGIADRVRFVGHQHPAPYLACSDLFVLPSRIESFGMAYAEAMSMGLPCIGLRNRPPDVLSSASDVIPEGVAGYCVDSVEELRDRIDQLAADPTLRRSLGEAACHLATTEYTTESYVERIRSLAGAAGWPVGLPESAAAPREMVGAAAP